MNKYKNEMKIPTDLDLTDEEIKIYNHIKKQASKLLINHAAEQIAYYLKMYLKYGCIDNCSYKVHAKSILEDHIFGTEVDTAISYSKIILKNKYNIDIEQDKPLILSCNVPLEVINEDYN